MRPSTRSRRSVLLLLALAISIVLVSPSPSFVLAQQDGVTSEDAAQEPAYQDVCAPLHEAQTILAALQPAPYAHLEHKFGPSVSTSAKGWGDGLGWGQEGPLATTLRLLPRLINTLLSPTQLLSKLPLIGKTATPKKGVRIGRARKDKIEAMMRLIDEAENAGCVEALAVKAKLRMFPPKGVKQDLTIAYDLYKTYLQYSADPEAQFMVGFFHAAGLGGAELDQGKALLYYTFAAAQGYRPASMALGYRHWAGIGVKEDCLIALDHYSVAAKQSYQIFLDGPPGGRTLPLTLTRLSDRAGGAYGPYASWASTGANAYRAAIRGTLASARGETEKETLEYFQYQADRGSLVNTVRLGRVSYHGSVYFSLHGVSSGADSVGEIPRDYKKAKEYFLRVARVMWPSEFEADGSITKRKKMSKEVEDSVRDPAMVAAAFLGRMAMRGEGGKPDYARARLWYERAAELGDREALNGLGIIHRDGLIVPSDKQKADHFFQAAASQDLADAQVQLAKLHLDRGEIVTASAFLEVALRHGSTFEAFHLLGRIHAANAKSGTTPGMCGVAVAYEKLVAERGNWGEDWVGEADRAWARGEEDKAFIGWMVGAEMGYEAAQNNVAFVLEQGFRLGGSDSKQGQDKERALTQWIRSAAQDNVDAMVKVGDYFYEASVPSFDRAVAYYQTAADTQTSAMAYWNLGYMYENGQGVPRDWHLAKRFYDLAKETNTEAYLPVTLSLIKLYLRSWWIDLRSQGATPGLSLFEPDPNPPIQLSLLERIKALFMYTDTAAGRSLDDADVDPLNLNQNQMVEEEDGGMYEDYSGSGWLPAGGEDEELEDMVEDLILVLVLVGTVGLVWLRSRWAQQEREREERRRREGAVAAEAR
ncbi:hypothetical protein IAU60_001495 [Kwoniella sp. DSM 27419]